MWAISDFLLPCLLWSVLPLVVLEKRDSGGRLGGLKQKASEMLSRSDNFRDLRGKFWLRSQDEVTQSAVGFMLGCQPHQRHAATIPLQSFIRAQEWLWGQWCLFPVTAQNCLEG